MASIAEFSIYARGPESELRRLKGLLEAGMEAIPEGPWADTQVVLRPDRRVWGDLAHEWYWADLDHWDPHTQERVRNPDRTPVLLVEEDGAWLLAFRGGSKGEPPLDLLKKASAFCPSCAFDLYWCIENEARSLQ